MRLLALALLLAACASPLPAASLPPQPDLDLESCAQACARWADAGCIEGERGDCIRSLQGLSDTGICRMMASLTDAESACAMHLPCTRHLLTSFGDGAPKAQLFVGCP